MAVNSKTAEAILSGSNVMSFTNMASRAGAFPIEKWSIFGALSAAEAYVRQDASIPGYGDATGLPYEGQVIAVREDGAQTVYVLDNQQANGLRKLATGGDADELARKLSALSGSLLSADGIVDQLSGAISANAGSISEISTVTVPGLKQSLSVTVEELATPIGDDSTTYVVKQGGLSVGDYISIPKDKVFESAYMVGVKGQPASATKETISAFVVTYDTTTVTVLSDDTSEEGTPVAAGTFASIKNAYFGKEGGDGPYLRITVSNQETPVYIAMPKLVDTYYGATTDTVKVEISQSHEISASVLAGAIGTVHLSADAVTNAKLADDAVQTENIKDLNVTEAKLADDAVTNAKIADNAVAAAQISADAVETGKIKDGAVTSDKLAADSVVTSKIADGNVTTAKIADSNVTAAKLATDSVETAKIKNGNVTTEKIADGNVTTDKIADSNVTEGKIATGAVTEGKIATDAVTNGKIKDGAVSEGKIAAGAVTNTKLAKNSVALMNLSSDVTDYIDQAEANAVSTSEAYTDAEIQKLDVTVTGMAASKTLATLTETDGKIAATFQDISIQESQVANLTDDIGYISGQVDGVKNDYLLKSTFSTISVDVGLDKASPSDKVAIVSEVTAEAERAGAAEQFLSARLSAAEDDIDALQTSAETLDGKIDGEIQDRKDAISGLSATVARTFLSVSVYDKFKNDSGLSAVTGHEGESDYQVVFVKDIKDLEGAMHFRGVTTTALSTGDTVIPAGTGYYDESAGKVPTAGDLVINDTTSKEFAWAGDKWKAEAERPAGWNGRWVELGDESIYLTKAEFESFKTDTFNPWKLSVELSADGFKTRFETDEGLISELSNTVIPAEAERAKGVEEILSGQISALSTYTHALSVSQLVWDIDVISCGAAGTN